MKRSLVIKPTLTAKEIKHEHYDLLNDVTAMTIRHRLQTKLGLPAHHAARKPFLNERVRNKRIFFCKKYVTWTADDWNNVLFSDESTLGHS